MGAAAAQFIWKLLESWKRLRLPAMTKNTRRFVLAFGLTLGGVLLIVAAAGIYRWGYNGAIAEKGTYDAGFAAAMAERGTYQEGYDAAIAEKGTYDDGYTAGFAKGKTEGYEEGYAAGHEDGSSEGYDAGYDSGTSDAAQSAAEAEKNTRVGVQAPRFPVPQLTGLPAGHQTEGNDAAGSRGRRLYVLRLVLVNTRRK